MNYLDENIKPLSTTELIHQLKEEILEDKEIIERYVRINKRIDLLPLFIIPTYVVLILHLKEYIQIITGVTLFVFVSIIICRMIIIYIANKHVQLYELGKMMLNDVENGRG